MEHEKIDSRIENINVDCEQSSVSHTNVSEIHTPDDLLRMEQARLKKGKTNCSYPAINVFQGLFRSTSNYLGIPRSCAPGSSSCQLLTPEAPAPQQVHRPCCPRDTCRQGLRRHRAQFSWSGKTTQAAAGHPKKSLYRIKSTASACGTSRRLKS